MHPCIHARWEKLMIPRFAAQKKRLERKIAIVGSKKPRPFSVAIRSKSTVKGHARREASGTKLHLTAAQERSIANIQVSTGDTGDSELCVLMYLPTLDISEWRIGVLPGQYNAVLHNTCESSSSMPSLCSESNFPDPQIRGGRWAFCSVRRIV